MLVLHGGASRGDRMMVSPTQLSVIRMIPTARAVARVAQDRLAVYRLLNSYRGWDSHHTPVADAAWGMAQVREQHGDLPFGLVGHSLGGRAALLAGELPGVESVVALNPWVYPTDTADLTGRRVLIVHGEQDRIASPAKAEAVAQQPLLDGEGRVLPDPRRQARHAAPRPGVRPAGGRLHRRVAAVRPAPLMPH